MQDKEVDQVVLGTKKIPKIKTLDYVKPIILHNINTLHYEMQKLKLYEIILTFDG